MVRNHTTLTLTIWWYLLLQHVAAFYHISPEKPISLSMEACSYERQLLNDNVVVLFPETLRSCGSFHTSKRQDDYDNDLKRVTSLVPTVQIIWHEMGNPNTCELEYKGYQKNYRISPDLGYYIGCQKALSQYRSQLAIRKTPIWNTSNANCPLKSLPKNYEGYLACDFMQGKWYEILFKSTIRYEPISFLIHYRIRLDSHVHYVSLIANRTVEDWMSDTFILIPSRAVHEVCYQDVRNAETEIDFSQAHYDGNKDDRDGPSGRSSDEVLESRT
uniref:Uncharacterized protein n=1 Tax=Loa loa TaxID=7209 RepID=A0A1I7VXX6_LOALO